MTRPKFKHNGFIIEKSANGTWTAHNQTKYFYSFNLDTIFKKIDTSCK